MIKPVHEVTAPADHVMYRPDIDGLRAVAVVAVLIFHAFPGALQGGFTGVDVFFVISGFLISSNIYKGLDNNTFSFVGFYARRFRRIFPALTIVLAAVLLFGWFALFPDEYASLGKHVAAGAGFVSNIILLTETGYFDASAWTKPLLHLWSLGVEEQFYIFWPLAVAAAWKLKLSRGILYVLTLAASFVLSIHLLGVNQSSAFYLPHSRFWELMVGALLAHWHLLSPLSFSLSRKVISVTLGSTLPLMGLLLIALSYVWAQEGSSFPGYWATLPTAGAAMIIAADPQCWISRNLLSARPMVWIGLISYPLYLWHWPILSIARVMNGGPPSTWVTWALLLIAVAFSWLTYRLVETPLRHRKGNTIVALLIGAMTLIGLAGASIGYWGGLPDRSNVAPYAKLSSLLVGTTWKYTSNDVCTSTYPDTFRYFCYQRDRSPPDAMLIGNSFANHLYAGFIENPELAHLNVLSYGSCQPGGRPIDCEEQRKIIENNPSIKYVFISERWPRPDSDAPDKETYNGTPKFVAGTTENQYKTFWGDYIDFLMKRGIKVFIFGPKPEVTYDARSCFSRPLMPAANSCTLSRSEADRQTQAMTKVLRDLTESRPGVVYFDQMPLICGQKECSLTKNGLPLLRDETGHYSEYGSAQQLSRFVDWARGNWPEILK